MSPHRSRWAWSRAEYDVCAWSSLDESADPPHACSDANLSIGSVPAVQDEQVRTDCWVVVWYKHDLVPWREQTDGSPCPTTLPPATVTRSTLVSSLATGVPIVADNATMNAYTYLHPDHVFMKGKGEDEVDVMLKVLTRWLQNQRTSCARALGCRSGSVLFQEGVPSPCTLRRPCLPVTLHPGVGHAARGSASKATSRQSSGRSPELADPVAHKNVHAATQVVIVGVCLPASPAVQCQHGLQGCCQCRDEGRRLTSLRAALGGPNGWLGACAAVQPA